MARENYYLILGVSQSESPAGIRARYRELVRMLHPDVAGVQSTAAFQRVAEAYAVLGDPLARRRHDADLATWQSRPSDRWPTRAHPGRREPVRWLGEPLAAGPFLDPLLERVFPTFTGIGVPKTEEPEGVTVEVILTSDEAARGVEVPIAVPRIESCDQCAGRGRVWLFPCDVCWGQGLIGIERRVWIQIPPVVRPESIIAVPLHELGIHNLCVRIYVRIE